MKKYLAVLLVAGLLVGSLAVSSQAYFTTNATTNVVGHTGYVQLTAPCKVILPSDMQPGHYWVRQLKLHNSGKCPVRVVVKLDGVPSFLRVTITPSYIGNLNPCQVRIFTLRVEIPSSIGNPAQNKPVSFRIHFYGRNN